MKFLIDNNLSPHLAAALHALSEPQGHVVVHLRDKFPANTPDHEWIEALASEGNWVIVTRDRIGKNDLERKALRQTGIVTFMLKSAWNNRDFWSKAWNLVKWWPRIVDHAGGVTNGVFLVGWRTSGKGKFETVKV